MVKVIGRQNLHKMAYIWRKCLRMSGRSRAGRPSHAQWARLDGRPHTCRHKAFVRRRTTSRRLTSMAKVRTTSILDRTGSMSSDISTLDTPEYALCIGLQHTHAHTHADTQTDTKSNDTLPMTLSQCFCNCYRYSLPLINVSTFPQSCRRKLEDSQVRTT